MAVTVANSADRLADLKVGAPAIELVDVAEDFAHAHGEDVHAVRNMNLAIGEGEFFSLLGLSGCGKTTTMRMIAGLRGPHAGLGLPARR